MQRWHNSSHPRYGCATSRRPVRAAREGEAPDDPCLDRPRSAGHTRPRTAHALMTAPASRAGARLRPPWAGPVPSKKEPPMPLTDVAPGYTRMYLSQREVAEKLGLSRTHVGRLVRTNLFPTPDVWIATYLNGWSEERAIEFGQDAGILDAHGARLLDPETGRPVALTDGARTRTDRLRNLIADKYSEPPVPYLGTALIAALYQQAPAAIYTTRNRVRFIP